MQTVQQTMPHPYRWPRARYERLAESGVLDDQHVELIGGQIVAMSPKGPRHAVVTGEVRAALEASFARDGFHVREEKPLALGEWDEPEPDLAVVVGRGREYLAAHPTAARTPLVVEIADTTARYDLGHKADIYAAAEIVDYWVVLPAEREVVVCRRPGADADSLTHVRYAERRAYRPGEMIAPLHASGRPIPVSDLLP